MSEFFKKKSNIIIVAVVAIVLIILIASFAGYNGLVSKQETIEERRSQISVQLQRRADLIPNFVETAKGYSDYEQETFTAVTEARAAVKNATSVEQQAAAATQLEGAIDVWVNAITESYPELKSDKLYIQLQDELAGSENRIAVARRDYNTAVKEYNSKVKRFPSNIIAGMFGFEAEEYFEADPSATEAPEVSFD
ncbi:MAG: LemA family protein [Clostridia bacterium]|nr:LemA family protein [Clostridia bacterium]